MAIYEKSVGGRNKQAENKIVLSTSACIRGCGLGVPGETSHWPHRHRISLFPSSISRHLFISSLKFSYNVAVAYQLLPFVDQSLKLPLLIQSCITCSTNRTHKLSNNGISSSTLPELVPIQTHSQGIAPSIHPPQRAPYWHGPPRYQRPRQQGLD